jgi:hypothetical protein
MARVRRAAPPPSGSCSPIYLSIYLFTSTSPSIYLSIDPFIYLSISIYIYLSIYLSTSIYLSMSISGNALRGWARPPAPPQGALLLSAGPRPTPPVVAAPAPRPSPASRVKPSFQRGPWYSLKSQFPQDFTGNGGNSRQKLTKRGHGSNNGVGMRPQGRARPPR